MSTSNGECRYVQDVVSYKVEGNKRHRWIAYKLKDKNKTVILQNLINGTKRSYTEVDNFNFDISNRWFVCNRLSVSRETLLYDLNTSSEKKFDSVFDFKLSNDGNRLLLNKGNVLEYFVFSTETENNRKIKSYLLWSSSRSRILLYDYNFDGTGTKVVFTLGEKSIIDTSRFIKSIWFWKEGLEKPEKRVEDLELGKGVFIEGQTTFTEDGNCISAILQVVPESPNSQQSFSEVDVWSYKDSILQSTQLANKKEPETLNILVNADSGKIIWIDKQYERLYYCTGNYSIIGNKARNYIFSLKHGDRFWDPGFYLDSIWMVSLKDGSRKFITANVPFSTEMQISPSRKYAVYYDRKEYKYFSFNFETGNTVDISSGIAKGVLGVHHSQSPFGVKEGIEADLMYWLPDKESVLVYDEYDIWLLDYTGKKQPVNITNGYGRLNKIIFRVIKDVWENKFGSSFYFGKDTLLLNAFNCETKFNGYYLLHLGSKSNPGYLFMGPYFMDVLPGTYGITTGGMPPLKALDAKKWIIKRESVKDAPNYFITQDFKKFEALSMLNPSKPYNWLTSELHTFKRLDGSIGKGVLYKPENFDSTKKYPVIVSFYLTLSDRLNQYPQAQFIDAPNLTWGTAWMVSHGYLVFMPDIKFTEHQYGPSTVNTMDGAAKYLSQLGYVDGKKIGACGHSNSGRFGYYLLTHSKIFAAMSIGAGHGGPDILSGALSLWNDNDGSALNWAESEASGTGLGPIWSNKDSWIDHTAVLHADRVTSPFLMFFNNGDANPVRYGAELFIALRRLEKKTWWLQYDHGDHTLGGMGNDAKDFTIRFTQFFDHYLKDAPAPRWMTQGIPAKLKAVDNGFELDKTGWCGKDCEVCIRSHKNQIQQK